MYTVQETEAFSKWLYGLRDRAARARIHTRMARLAAGHVGDAKSIGNGISELRINYGPGYRVYYIQRGKTVILLLAGGDKKSQARDISVAIEIAKTLPKEEQ